MEKTGQKPVSGQLSVQKLIDQGKWEPRPPLNPAKRCTKVEDLSSWPDITSKTCSLFKHPLSFDQGPDAKRGKKADCIQIRSPVFVAKTIAQGDNQLCMIPR
ncbi:U1 [Cuiaba virus]|uniref:U1 n=1 Tax=Cuiaba virus TaxID=2495751 RepID=A0A3S8TMP8_9RHAB|nr:U1 [Cuiaba virus]AZL49343.1 U1 [Cuiaba virus]